MSMKKIFIRNNRVDCYRAIGVSDKVGLMYNYIKERKDVQQIRDKLYGNYSLVNLVA